MLHVGRCIRAQRNRFYRIMVEEAIQTTIGIILNRAPSRHPVLGTAQQTEITPGEKRLLKHERTIYRCSHEYGNMKGGWQLSGGVLWRDSSYVLSHGTLTLMVPAACSCYDLQTVLYTAPERLNVVKQSSMHTYN